MEYSDLIAGMLHFGANSKDIFYNCMGVDENVIGETVIVSPGWTPQTLSGLGTFKPIVNSSPLFGYQVWNVSHDDLTMTFIKTGFGAPAVMDAVLLLGLSKCKRLFFVSSVGALKKDIGIGDLVIPKYSVSGDGASRYISSNSFKNDVFGQKNNPDNALFEKLKIETAKICDSQMVNWHIGMPFCTDTIFAQYPYIDDIIDMGCDTIDMESAAAFKTAEIIGVPIVALLNVSDNTVQDQSLMSASTDEIKEYRKFVRGEVMPQIIHRLILKDKGSKV